MKKLQIFLIRHTSTLIDMLMWSIITFFAIFTYIAMGFHALLSQFIVVGGVAILGLLAVLLVSYVSGIMQNTRNQNDDDNNGNDRD